MFFNAKKRKEIDKIKNSYLKNKPLLRKISIYADNEILDIQNVFVLKKMDEIEKNFLAKKFFNQDNFFIENFSNVDAKFLTKNYDLILVKIDFKIAELINSDFHIKKIDLSYSVPTNLWVLQKGSIDFFDLKNKTTLSNRPLIMNKKTI